MFIGRKKELDYLKQYYISDKAEFVVLYGRRRIGKTELIKEFIKDKKYIFYSAVEITDSIQLERFSKKILDSLGSSKYLSSFSSWEDAFMYISDKILDHEKLIIALDEFPYMVDGNKSIPSLLQNIWDNYLKDKNIMLIISGSSMSFMERKILSEKNPLYGRATGIYKLREMDYFTAKEFTSNYNTIDSITLYGIFSGVPHYLNQIDNKISLEENIKKNILRNGTLLFNEVEFLLKQELRDVLNYNSIIEAIALGNTKLNDIYTKTEIDKNKLPYYINNLIDLNIIEREFPITLSTKEKAKSRIGLYKLSNSYFRFYYSFVYPNLSELIEYDIDGVYDDLVKPFLNQYIGLEFEKICIQYLRKENIKRKLPFRFSRIGRWWYKDCEIDIVAYDNKENIIFAECKWKNKEVGMNELDTLMKKSNQIKLKSKNKYYYLFSKNGFTKKIKDLNKQMNNLYLVDVSNYF